MGILFRFWIYLEYRHVICTCAFLSVNAECFWQTLCVKKMSWVWICHWIFVNAVWLRLVVTRQNLCPFFFSWSPPAAFHLFVLRKLEMGKAKWIYIFKWSWYVALYCKTEAIPWPIIERKLWHFLVNSWAENEYFYNCKMGRCAVLLPLEYAMCSYSAVICKVVDNFIDTKLIREFY